MRRSQIHVKQDFGFAGGRRQAVRQDFVAMFGRCGTGVRHLPGTRMAEPTVIAYSMSRQSVEETTEDRGINPRIRSLLDKEDYDIMNRRNLTARGLPRRTSSSAPGAGTGGVVPRSADHSS